MNVEENRLQTFVDWPSDAHVNPIRLARAGFFYTKEDYRVECFACHLNLWEWSYGDQQVMAKHQQLSPDCPFVKDPATSGNIPNISISTSNNNSQSMEFIEDLHDEATRLRTFANWPATAIVTPESLARAGFYSLLQNDLTKCAFCSGVVGAWEAGDNPDLEHGRHFPNCSFVLNTIVPRLGHDFRHTTLGISRLDCAASPATVSVRDLSNRSNLPNINLVRDGNLAALGVNTHKGPKKPKYGTLESRLATFANWPEDLVQTPDALAQAGFYYEGSSDQVRCFHCDGGLKHWDPHDEPWTEHARWFPHCGFVALLKGQDFIAACSPELDPATIKEWQAVSAQRNKKTAQHRKEITERELQAHMLSESTRSALDVGIQVDRIRQAIREKLERTGVGFSTGDALIEATLNLQRDEDDNDEDNQISISVNHMLSDVISSLREPDTTTSTTASSARKSSSKSKEAKSKQQQQQESKANRDTGDTRPTTSHSNINSSSSGTNKLSLEEENRLLKEARLCKICMDSEVGIVFLPCGHLATCINCAPNLQDCPVCRSAIKATVRTFLS